jgi:hypothetical protein
VPWWGKGLLRSLLWLEVFSSGSLVGWCGFITGVLFNFPFWLMTLRSLGLGLCTNGWLARFSAFDAGAESSHYACHVSRDQVELG